MQPQPQPPAEPEFPNIHIVKPPAPAAAETTVQAASPLAGIWDRLGVGNATSIDLNQNPALQSTLRRMGVAVPRDGILRKPAAPTGRPSATPASTGTVIVLARDGTVIQVAGTVSPTAGPILGPPPGASAPARPGYPSPPPAGWSGAAASRSAGVREAVSDEEEEVVVRHDSLPKDAPGFWTALDADRDAQISLFEWRTGGRSVEEFAARDLNSDGYLVLDEYTRSLELAPAAEPDRGTGRRSDR